MWIESRLRRLPLKITFVVQKGLYEMIGKKDNFKISSEKSRSMWGRAGGFGRNKIRYQGVVVNTLIY